ncbi:MAG: DUF1614 domain-containing protein [Candidatus Bathyarchaeia archaeon]|jgi:uncharacterized membrane protein
MSRKTIYVHHSFLFFAILVALLVVVVALVFFGAISVAFEKVGFTPFTILLILAGTLIGSFINIPLLKLRTTVPVIREDSVSWFGMTYQIPQIEYGEAVTQVAVNVGGALIPTAVCIYLLIKSAPSTIILSFIGVVAVALVTHLVAKPVKGVGISTPAFIPPIAAAVAALVLAPAHPLTIAYIAGVLGTLIGADLLNLQKIPKLGAPVASIGGAGTFDGVFLTGIIAVLLAAFFG